MRGQKPTESISTAPRRRRKKQDDNIARFIARQDDLGEARQSPLSSQKSYLVAKHLGKEDWRVIQKMTLDSLEDPTIPIYLMYSRKENMSLEEFSEKQRYLLDDIEKQDELTSVDLTPKAIADASTIFLRSSSARESLKWIDHLRKEPEIGVRVEDFPSLKDLHNKNIRLVCWSTCTFGRDNYYWFTYQLEQDKATILSHCAQGSTMYPVL